MRTVITWAPSGMEGGVASCNTVSAVFQASDRGRSLVFSMVNYPPILRVADGVELRADLAVVRSPLPCPKLNAYLYFFWQYGSIAGGGVLGEDGVDEATGLHGLHRAVVDEQRG